MNQIINVRNTIAKKGGRPTKYRTKFVKEVDRYLDEIKSKQNQLPTIEGFSIRIDVNIDTIGEWTKQYPKFSVAIRKIMRKQKEKLIQDGVYNKDANSTIVKLLLMNNHGMREKQDTDITSGGIAFPILGGISKENENKKTDSEI